MNSSYMYAAYRERAQEIYAQNYYNTTPLGISFVQSGFILPYKKQTGNWEDCLGGVVDADLNFVSSSKMSFGPLFGGSYPIDVHNCTHLKEKTVVFCGMLSPIWGHFLFDSLARLWYATQNPGSYVLAWLYDSRSKATLFTEDNELKDNFARTLDLLQIDKKNILLISEQDKPVTANMIIVPECGFISGQYYTSEFKRFYTQMRDSVPTSQDKKYEKIFISRKHWKDQREFGMNVIEDVFINNNFTCIIPEDTPLEKMISYLKRASIVVSPEGSASHNTIFCSEGTEVVLLRRNKSFNHYQPIIDHAINAKTTIIDPFPASNLLQGLPEGPFTFYNNSNVLRFYKNKNLNFQGMKRIQILLFLKGTKIIFMSKLRGSDSFSAKCLIYCVDLCKNFIYRGINILRHRFHTKK